MTARSAPELIWQAAGFPLAKWPLGPCAGVCATCGVIVTEGVSHERINQESFSQQGDFFQYGSHCCPACAWLYSDARKTHRGVIAAGDWIAWPLISVETAAGDPGRPSWLDALRHLATLPPDTPVAGVMTSDPKPRFWPRARLGTTARPALYVHWPDHDLSNLVRFETRQALAVADLAIEALTLGFSKRAIIGGLYRDFARVLRAGQPALALEQQLAAWRSDPAFLPAALAAGIRKGAPIERPDPGKPAGGAEPVSASGGSHPENRAGQLQLL